MEAAPLLAKRLIGAPMLPSCWAQRHDLRILSGTGAEERAQDPEESFKMFQSCSEYTTSSFGVVVVLQLWSFSAYQDFRRFPRKSALVALSSQTNPWPPWSPLISPRRMAPRSVASTLSPAESLEPEGISEASTGKIALLMQEILRCQLYPFTFDFETVDFSLPN